MFLKTIQDFNKKIGKRKGNEIFFSFLFLCAVHEQTRHHILILHHHVSTMYHQEVILHKYQYRQFMHIPNRKMK